MSDLLGSNLDRSSLDLTELIKVDDLIFIKATSMDSINRSKLKKKERVNKNKKRRREEYFRGLMEGSILSVKGD